MNIIKSTYIILVSFLIMNMFVSCEKMLEVDVPTHELPSDIIFEDVQTANSALAGLYAKMRDNAPLAANGSGALLGIYTDDLDYYANPVSNATFDLFNNTQIDTNTTVSSFWSESYEVIYIANSIISGCDSSLALPTSEKNRIKGEALLARSLILLYLQQIFGDIPYPISTDYTINQVLGKTASDQVLIQLANDVNLSISLLPNEYRSAERIFLNKKAGELILAKIYMIQQRYTEAEILLKGIVSDPRYVFEQDLTKVFTKTGKHIIWQLKPQNGAATKESTLYYFGNVAPSLYALSGALAQSFVASDLRKTNWTASSTFNGNTWLRSSKYKNRLPGNDTEYSIVFRLEEAYLLLSECYLQQNRLNEALPYVNATRQRASLVPLGQPISKENLLNEIILENRHEFFAEMGHRFLDLKRINRLNSLIPIKPNWKSYHLLWPIPQKEVLMNANLKPQNSGY
ncbi:RagB/SusD family nutrient uptake outer membrane protein [Chryseobacterium sp. G0240]|uniref:RagB/SusD family nutrient uptake outer membrane protein n=1 Tax=Chryseobacterium sp. G0240 TaxID=2487066 RepID=UPI000F45C4D3|nr:RagB/SusD family nutrient uptake outer membrane protein [Chryseobacterium sp. G0240]ROI02525.1 RagB/SusD family nutrient uptake outer membrane protein [Chryseobacterium sp. G0240]